MAEWVPVPQPREGLRLISVSVKKISNRPKLTEVVPNSEVYCELEVNNTGLGQPLFGVQEPAHIQHGHFPVFFEEFLGAPPHVLEEGIHVGTAGCGVLRDDLLFGLELNIRLARGVEVEIALGSCVRLHFNRVGVRMCCCGCSFARCGDEG